jgi:RNA polymerase sigma-B factor
MTRSGHGADAKLRRRAGELRLARYARSGDRAQRDQLVEQYLPLARSLAARYRHSSENFDDLLQVATVGLIRAIDRFDPSHGTAFSSFAVPTILGELRRHLRDHTWSVRVPRPLQQLAQRLGPATDRLAAHLGRPPTPAELAHELGTTEEDILDARQAASARNPASLDQPVSVNTESATVGELLGGEDSALAAIEVADMLERALAALPRRTREILRLRFEEDLKQREIGARLGISQMQVSRLLRQALDHLHTIGAVAANEGS